MIKQRYSIGVSIRWILMLLLFIPSVVTGNNSRYVNLFIGTAGDHGQVDPAACVPYGMVRICPDSQPRSHSGYDYDVEKISGFSVNRLSGIGCGGAGGNLCLKPASLKDSLRIDKKTEKAIPGYYTVTCDNGVKCQFTATHNVAVEHYTFSKKAPHILSLDFGSSFTKVIDLSYRIVSTTEIEGYIHAGNTCDHGGYKLYFSMSTDHPFRIETQDKRCAQLSFESKVDKNVEVRIALSPIDVQTAKQERQLIAEKSFKVIQREASARWEDLLSRVDIKATETEKVLFYTSLYRVFLSPANVTSANGDYLGTDGNRYSADGFTYYSSWSMWDSYRTKFPFIAFLDRKTMKDICRSLAELYKNGKEDWATDYESTPTVRTEHSLVVLLDAFNKKNITQTVLSEAYSGIAKDIKTFRTDRPDQAFETAIDYWAFSNIAKILHHDSIANAYDLLSKELFDNTWKTEFEHIDTSFIKMRNNGLYQGTRWQYRWALPQYIDRMAESVGGKDKLNHQLSYFFDNNLNNQGNEPGIHAPYLFNRLGNPQKSQSVVTKMLTEKTTHLYGGNAEYPTPVYRKIFEAAPNGFLPEMDEDDGTMSAWYAFSTIGLFPLIVGDPIYEIVSPLYDSISIKLCDDKLLRIIAKNRKTKLDPIKSIRFNNKQIDNYSINYNDLMSGGLLMLEY